MDSNFRDFGVSWEENALVREESEMGRVEKVALAIHGGASDGSDFLDTQIELYEEGLERAITAGYKVLMEVAIRLKIGNR